MIPSGKGCTVTTFDIADDDKFSFYCEIVTGNNTIYIYNRYYNRPFSATGTMQVVFGVMNPSSIVTFNMKLYSWYINDTNYAILVDTDGSYTPNVTSLPRLLQRKNQVKMYPFFTRVDSDVIAPFRIGLKLNVNVTVPLSYQNMLNLTNYFIFEDFDALALSTTIFECHMR